VNPVPGDPLPDQPATGAPGSISELLAAATSPATSSAAFDAGFIHRERMAGLGELTAGIAHELNNPIGYIGSNLNTLRRYVETVSALMAQAQAFMEPAQRGAWEQALDAARWPIIGKDLVAVVDETQQGAEQVRNIVGDLKLLARTSITPEQGSVDQCVLSALTVLTHQLKHRCHVERDLASRDGLLLVRPQIIQLVINLVHNAGQAVASGGHVRLTSRSQESLVTLTIEDDGPGVPEHQRLEIFQPFYTSKKGGTGLGLPIVARIARNHGGDVRIDRSPDLGGARFIVELRHWQGAGVA
jgi:signal transduction histidine kinase